MTAAPHVDAKCTRIGAYSGRAPLWIRIVLSLFQVTVG